MKNQAAFTLVELLITLAIAGIFASLAGPSFSTMLKNNSMAIETNTLLSHINSARSEAIKRGNNVVLCKSSNNTSCTTSDNWEQGWIMYSDANNNNTLATDGTEDILRVQQKLSNSTLAGNTPYKNRIVYRPTGRSSQAGALILCADMDGDGDIEDDDDFSSGHAIIISTTGRPRSADTSESSFTDCTP
jgi:type IV fimbrial biogenesis protein FimT